jgi:serine O-acetyltransferase
MKLVSILLADLQRQYHFSGCTARQATRLGLTMQLMNPRFMPVVLCRLAHYFYIHRISILARIMSLLNFLFFGTEIAMRCEIGEGVYFPHTSGTVIGALKIGKNAVIYQGVTIGAKMIDYGYQADARPVIGDNVVLGSGAKVLGNITIGNHVIIGANAVVNKSLPDYVVAGGIPAQIIRKNPEHKANFS